MQFRDKIGKAKKELANAMTATDSESIIVVLNCKSNLNNLLAQEETYWRQRVKKFWLRRGDQNSKFFHASTSSRKKGNQIMRLRQDDRIWIEKQQELNEAVLKCFQSLFVGENCDTMHAVGYIKPKVVDDDNNKLLALFTFEKFRQAVF
ncbi:hypothetical protein DITRI_Ditri19aG0104200 [Diplodiscus trichospermus]